MVQFIGLNLLYTLIRTKQKEEFQMKKAKARRRNLTVYSSQYPAYPNAADRNYFNRKALDILTAIVSGAGMTTAMIFLATLI